MSRLSPSRWLAGGMGNVWLARRNDGRFEGMAAIKLLNASLSITT